MKIYTKTGDHGQSGLIGGERADKCDLRLEAYGTLDELNAHLALLREYVSSEELGNHLVDIQKHLFRLSAQLATSPLAKSQKVWDNYRQTSERSLQEIQGLEDEIDLMDASLPPLDSFVLPGGNKSSAQCHVCRTVCRRAERCCVALHRQTPVDESILRYLNRLSDYLFVLSRKLCLNECEEMYWNGE